MRRKDSADFSKPEEAPRKVNKELHQTTITEAWEDQSKNAIPFMHEQHPGPAGVPARKVTLLLTLEFMGLKLSSSYTLEPESRKFCPQSQGLR